MTIVRRIFTVLLILAYFPLIGVVLFMWSTGYLGELFRGPTVVQEQPSPDARYVAYVCEEPSIDPPNQRLLVERADKTRFLAVAKLAGDIDSIEEIVWSPDSQIVVFHSRCYLTATRVSDWQTIRVYLGKEWRRHKPSRRTTFSGAQPVRRVTAVEFAAPGTVSYQIDDAEAWHLIQMNSAAPQTTAVGQQPNQVLQASVAGAPQPQR